MTSPRSARRLPVSTQVLGVVLVLVSAAGFGSGPLLVQPLYEAGMEATVVLFWRFATAALFGWGFLLASTRRRASLMRLTRRRATVLALLGCLYVINSFSFIASLQVVPISLASIIAYLYPAIVAVMATRLVRSLEGRRAWLALGISIVGVALTVGGIPEGELPPLWGLGLAFLNPVVYATWIVLQSRLAGDRPRAPRGATGTAEPGLELPPADAETATDSPDPSPAAAIMTSATAAVYAVVVLLTGGSLSPLDVPGGVWLPLLGFGLIATALAIQAFYAGVRRVGGARASLISTVEPVYTVVLAVLLFGERLTAMQLLGGALVIFAVILAETGRRVDDEPAASRSGAADTVAGEGNGAGRA